MPDPVPLDPPNTADALVRVIESAPEVRRRYHFFMWTQGPMQLLLPHCLMVCGAYERQRKEVVLETFHSVVVPAPVLASLSDMRSALMRSAVAAWTANRGRPLLWDPARAAQAAHPFDSAALLAAGYTQLMLHGVSRPQRPNEIETFFVFASPKRLASTQNLLNFDLMLPYLHSAYLRVRATERGLASPPAIPRPRGSALPTTVITGREKQVLGWVRDGKSNQQIGEALGISPLTVKNHVQKILRKLGATNRAQAVAMAIAMQALAGSASESEHEHAD